MISYTVSHLHSLQSYTFVTTITYYTLTHLHWLTSQLSINFSNYHRLYIFTLRNSRRELTPRIHFLRLLLNNWLVGLLLTKWLLRHPSSSSIVRASLLPVVRAVSRQRARWGLCYVTHGNAKVTWYFPTPVAGWRHGGMLRRNRIPMLLLRDVIASARKNCLPVGYQATLCFATQQWVDISIYTDDVISSIFSYIKL
jgi:hypothetical protein